VTTQPLNPKRTTEKSERTWSLTEAGADHEILHAGPDGRTEERDLGVPAPMLHDHNSRALRARHSGDAIQAQTGKKLPGATEVPFPNAHSPCQSDTMV
jgi:hypothetical protein